MVDLEDFKKFIEDIPKPKLPQPLQCVVLETFTDIVKSRRILQEENGMYAMYVVILLYCLEFSLIYHLLELH